MDNKNTMSINAESTHSESDLSLFITISRIVIFTVCVCVGGGGMDAVLSHLVASCLNCHENCGDEKCQEVKLNRISGAS